MFLSIDRLDVIETETFFNYFIKVIKAHTLADNLLSGEILAGLDLLYSFKWCIILYLVQSVK